MRMRYSSLWLILAIFLAVPFYGGQAVSKPPLPGDPFAGEDLSGSETETVPGDPFADESAFQDLFDDALEKDPEKKGMDVDLHGYAESRNRWRTGADHKWISTRQRLWLEMDGGFFAQSRFFASAALDFDPAAADLSDDHDTIRAHPEAVYVTVDTDRLDLIFGRKMLRWGTGDGINPLDLVNPVDHRDPVASGRADTRVPVLLGHAVVRLPTRGALQEASLEGVFIPLAQVNQLNAPGSAWESQSLKAVRSASSQGQLLLGGQEEPDDYIEDAEFGVRLALTFSGWDLSLIGFFGMTDVPVFARERGGHISGEEVFRLTPVHPSFSAFGINFAKGLDRSTIRGELALKPDFPVMLADQTAVPGYLRRSVVEGVAGVDRTFGTSLYTNLQYFGTFIPDAQGLAQDRYDHGITYEVHDLFFRDDLKAGLRGIISFSDQSWTCEPYAEYSLGDDWLIAASLFLFQGSDNSRYGQFSANDMLTLRLRYSF